MNKKKAFTVAVASMVLAVAAIQESLVQAGVRFQAFGLPLVNTSADALTPPVDQQALFLRKAKADDVQDWLGLARKQLAVEPLDATSLFVISIASERSDPALAAQALSLSERTSRRARITQLEKLRVAASANNVKSSLAYLDRLLTVTPEAVPIVAKFVTGLLEDPTAVTLLGQYGQRHWFPQMLVAATNQADRPQKAADLLEASTARASSLHESVVPTLVRNLAHDGDIDRARTIARRYGGLAEADMQEFGITPATTEPLAGPLNWTVINTDDGWGAVLGGRKIAFRVEAESSAVVLERYTGLAAGRYMFRYDVESDANGGELVWELACRGTAPQTVSIGAVTKPVPDSITYQAEVVIAPGCRSQHWWLRATSPIGAGPKEMVVSKLSLQAL